MKKLVCVLGLGAAMLSCSSDEDGGCGLAKASEKAGTPFTNGCGIAVSKSGRIAITVYNGGYGQPGEVRIYESYADLKAGNVQNTLEGVTAPEAVVFDSDENLFVAETEAVAGIRVYNSNDYYFLYSRTIQIGFNNPRGLAIDDQDRLYVADDGNGRIVRFDEPMTSDANIQLNNIGTGLKGIAIAGNKMYVTNYNLNNVTAYELGQETVIDANLGQVAVQGATDVSAKGNKVVVTSYATGKMTVLSGCDFSADKKNEYDAFGPCYGTAFVNGGKLIGAFYGQASVKEIGIN